MGEEGVGITGPRSPAAGRSREGKLGGARNPTTKLRREKTRRTESHIYGTQSKNSLQKSTGRQEGKVLGESQEAQQVEKTGGRPEVPNLEGRLMGVPNKQRNEKINPEKETNPSTGRPGGGIWFVGAKVSFLEKIVLQVKKGGKKHRSSNFTKGRRKRKKDRPEGR